MKRYESKRIGRCCLPGLDCLSLSILLTYLAVSPLQAQSPGDNREPTLGADCASIQVPDGQKVSFHVYARGVQIYRWTGSTWVFVAPDAVLYANEDHDGQVGTHYAGPSWESSSGSIVVGRRVAGCTPNTDSIPWLLLEAVTTDGPGIFNQVTYIQRVNTMGGLAPQAPGVAGQVEQVPYTAEYVFYRAE